MVVYGIFVFGYDDLCRLLGLMGMVYGGLGSFFFFFFFVCNLMTKL